MGVKRKSAANMFTDIAGYRKAMSESEQKAFEMLRKKWSIIKPLIHNHKGTWVKEISDGVNIASRVESLAPTCGVLISKNVNDELKEKFLNYPFRKQIVKEWEKIVHDYFFRCIKKCDLVNLRIL